MPRLGHEIREPMMNQAATLSAAYAEADARAAFIHKTYAHLAGALERRFMQHIGRDPAQEIRRIRINHVRQLLAKTNLSMQEIAISHRSIKMHHLWSIQNAPPKRLFVSC
jgi:transcriptional regulator GlxA family with amidase domain